MVVVDNNILSSLAKTKNLELLVRFFEEVKTTPGVINEFRNEKIKGYRFTKRIDEVKSFGETTQEEWLLILNLTNEENKEKEKILDKDESIGIADAECLIAAKKRDEILLTDDTYLGKKAQSQGIEVFDLETFLEACVRKKIIDDHSYLKRVFEAIETKDYYIFSTDFKDRVFKILERDN